MCHIIVKKPLLQRLVLAALHLQNLLDSGSLARAMSDNATDDKHAAVSAFDNLQEAARQVSSEDHGASPFLRYRREIMADTLAGEQLRALTLSLYGEAAMINLRSTLAKLNEPEQRIALELFVHFNNHGDRDRHFMNLALEIIEAGEVAA